MRYLQGLKSVNERVRIGETNMWVYMDAIIQENGAGEVHIEIDIGLDFWEIVARVSGNESGRECERFKIIDKVLDIQGDMQDGDVLWEEAKAHAKWIIESMDIRGESLYGEWVLVWGREAISGSRGKY